MKVYFVIRAEVWGKAKQAGILLGEPLASLCSYERAPVEWLCGEMGKRVEAYSGNTPIFGWTDRPPVEELDQYASAGEHVVLLEAEIDPARILATHFLGWAMYVMNGLYLSKDRDEDAHFDANPPTRAQLEESWSRIFEPWTLHPYFSEKTVQLAVDGVRISEVIRVVHHVVPKSEYLPPEIFYTEPEDDVAIALDDPRISQELKLLLSKPALYN